MSTYFNKKTVWITGASSGIGEAMAYVLANQGAELVLSGRNKAELERVAKACSPAKTHIQVLDLADHENLSSIANSVIERVGKVDILVNNGGLSQRSLARETTLEVDRQLLDVNLLGTITLSKALLPHFLERKTGHYVVITSLMGKFGGPLRSSYAAAKHGLHGFFDSLRAEVWRENIHVTLICPGFVQTKISLKALTGNGKPQNTMDDATANGLSAENFAIKAVNAIRRQTEEVYIGKKEVLGVYLKRFFPGILSRIMRKVKVT